MVSIHVSYSRVLGFISQSGGQLQRLEGSTVQLDPLKQMANNRQQLVGLYFYSNSQ